MRRNAAGRTTTTAVLTVALGTLGAQLVGALATPLLTRLYGPELLGILGSVLAYTGIVGPVAGLCLPIAIVLARSRGEAMGLARASYLIAAPIAAGTAILSPLIVASEAQIGVATSVLIVTAGTLIYTSVAVQVLQQVLIRNRRFRWLGGLTFSQAVIFACTQIAVGVLHPTATALLLVSSMNFVYFALFFWITRGRRDPLSVRRAPSKQTSSLRHVLRKFSDFPLYRAPQVLVNALGTHFPALALAALTELRWVGLLMVTQRILALPVIFIGRSISDVLYPQVVEMTTERRSPYVLLRNWTLLSGLASVPIALVLILAGERVFAFVLGEEWGGAGILAQALIPWMVGALACRPAVGAVPALHLQRVYLISDTVATVTKSITLVLLLTNGIGVLVAIVAWALISASGAVFITATCLLRARRGGFRVSP